MEEKLNTLIEQFGEFSNTLVEVKSTMDDFTHRLEALELKLGELSTKTTKSKKAAASIEEQLIKQTGPIKLHAKTITTKAKEEYKDNVEGFLNKYNIARADYDEAVKNHPDKVNDQFTELHSKYKVQINEIYTRVFNENQTTESGDSKSTTTTIVKSTKKTPKKTVSGSKKSTKQTSTNTNETSDNDTGDQDQDQDQEQDQEQGQDQCDESIEQELESSQTTVKTTKTVSGSKKSTKSSGSGTKKSAKKTSDSVKTTKKKRKVRKTDRESEFDLPKVDDNDDDINSVMNAANEADEEADDMPM